MDSEAAVQQQQAHRVPSSPPPPAATVEFPTAPVRPRHHERPPDRRFRCGGVSINVGIAVIVGAQGTRPWNLGSFLG
ncbi:hypothetical protein AURDEDRAFT_163789 [Auricularia subglabra TFB-10046 SS5]|nr:hypothetical protein AURDEDRAFT_163789 [Auricularia subglabra TFB-10046 SS5]